mgnify:CR=1 FL=1
MKRLIYLGVIVGIGVAGWIFGKPYYDLHFSTIDYSGEDKLVYVKTGSGLDDLAPTQGLAPQVGPPCSAQRVERRGVRGDLARNTAEEVGGAGWFAGVLTPV